MGFVILSPRRIERSIVNLNARRKIATEGSLAIRNCRQCACIRMRHLSLFASKQA